jgi:hypothetical protein
MQIVDVLRDDSRDAFRVFEARDCGVRDILPGPPRPGASHGSFAPSNGGESLNGQ